MLKYYHCLQRNQKPRKALLHLACEVFCLRKTVKDGIVSHFSTYNHIFFKNI